MPIQILLQPEEKPVVRYGTRAPMSSRCRRTTTRTSPRADESYGLRQTILEISHADGQGLAAAGCERRSSGWAHADGGARRARARVQTKARRPPEGVGLRRPPRSGLAAGSVSSGVSRWGTGGPWPRRNAPGRGRRGRRDAGPSGSARRFRQTPIAARR